MFLYTYFRTFKRLMFFFFTAIMNELMCTPSCFCFSSGMCRYTSLFRRSLRNHFGITHV
uniref:Uncharacterized protein n=1 Tax=Anguilla anguilla TaxID=7936 RepID=A0A0E9W8L7_ANGAN